ncbi:MAG: helix-turn-helix transcriptional regulator, partial [Terricaulis sp.]
MHLHDLRIGARVRQRRMELGLSQAALAKQLRLTFQQIQKYENGINRVAASTLIEIARALNAPAAWFFEEESAPTPQERLLSTVDSLAGLV